MTIVLRPDGLAWLKEQHGITSDKELALRVGIYQSNLSRVLKGNAEPGTNFIAGALNAFGGWRNFDTLFEIVPDPTKTAA
jgi:hypothetical protein